MLFLASSLLSDDKNGYSPEPFYLPYLVAVSFYLYHYRFLVFLYRLLDFCDRSCRFLPFRDENHLPLFRPVRYRFDLLLFKYRYDLLLVKFLFIGLKFLYLLKKSRLNSCFKLYLFFSSLYSSFKFLLQLVPF